MYQPPETKGLVIQPEAFVDTSIRPLLLSAARPLIKLVPLACVDGPIIESTWWSELEAVFQFNISASQIEVKVEWAKLPLQCLHKLFFTLRHADGSKAIDYL